MVRPKVTFQWSEVELIAYEPPLEAFPREGRWLLVVRKRWKVPLRIGNNFIGFLHSGALCKTVVERSNSLPSGGKVAR